LTSITYRDQQSAVLPLQEARAQYLSAQSILWTFLLDQWVPLDDNRAKRTLRPYVIWREKLSLGSHPRRGDRFRAQVLSVRKTVRRQDVPLYPFLRRICAEVLSAEGVTTRLPSGTARLRG